MSRATLVLAATAALAGLTAVPTVARATDCADQISAIERRLSSAGAVAVTGSTIGNQPVAEGSPKALPAPPPGPASTGDPGPTPERIATARGVIERAKAFDRAGDQVACNDAMSEAKRLIGALP